MKMHFLVCDSRFFLSFLGTFTNILQPKVRYMLRSGFRPFQTSYDVVFDNDDDDVPFRMSMRYRRA